MIYTFNFEFDNFFDVPTIEIGIDHTTYYKGVVGTAIHLDVTLETGNHQLWIKHYGKLLHQTSDTNDRHVFLKKLQFNNVDLDQLDYCPLTHRGKFYPDYEKSYIASCNENSTPVPEYIQPNHYFGHNGTWRLDYKSPELLWVIKEQNPSGIHLEDTMFSTSQNVINDVKDFFKL